MITTYLTDLARGYGLSVVSQGNVVSLLRGTALIAVISLVQHSYLWHCTPLGAGGVFALGQEQTLDDAVSSMESFLRHKLSETVPIEVERVWGLTPSDIFERAAQGGGN